MSIGLSLNGLDYAQYLLRHANINIFAYRRFDDNDENDDISEVDDGDDRYGDEEDEDEGFEDMKRDMKRKFYFLFMKR